MITYDVSISKYISSAHPEINCCLELVSNSEVDGNHLALAQGFQHLVRCGGRLDPLSYGIGHGTDRE